MEHPDIRRAMLTGYPILDTHDECVIISEPVDDTPVEDMFGSEIMPGDEWFQDEDGNVCLVENMRDYLTQEVGIDFFEAKK